MKSGEQLHQTMLDSDCACAATGSRHSPVSLDPCPMRQREHKLTRQLNHPRITRLNQPLEDSIRFSILNLIQNLKFSFKKVKKIDLVHKAVIIFRKLFSRCFQFCQGKKGCTARALGKPISKRRA